MFLDLKDLSETDHYDICVIGTGPAGITCAREAAKSGKRILLLEAGDLDWDDQSQDMYEGTVIGDPYADLTTNRVRYFGGTSNWWAGWCRPLDEWDFEPNVVDSHGWPISKTDLDPYLERAGDILDCGMPVENTPLAESGLNVSPFSYSDMDGDATRFRIKYKDELEASQNIFLVRRANAFLFRNRGNRSVELVVKSYEGSELVANAKYYVLATGGIENARLLLWSNAQANGTLIRSQSLGKYYMDHPDFLVGSAFIEKNYLESLRAKFDTPKGRPLILATDRQAIKEDKSLSCSIRVGEMRYSEGKELLADLACVVPKVGIRFAHLFDQDLVCGYRLNAVWEQAAVESNAVTLSDETDMLGMPRVDLYWSKSEFDKRTARVAVERLGAYLARSDLGRAFTMVWMNEGEPFIRDWFCAHHMGSTRMGHSFEDGVVDENCKVFGIDNLYLAGSSVFRSSGYVNPTFSIVQFSLRLGEHLAAK